MGAISNFPLSLFQFTVGVVAFIGDRYRIGTIARLCVYMSFIYMIADTARLLHSLCNSVLSHFIGRLHLHPLPPKPLASAKNVIMVASIVHHIASLLVAIAMLNVKAEHVFFMYLMCMRAMTVQLATPLDKHNIGRSTWTRALRILLSFYIHVQAVLGASLLIHYAGIYCHWDPMLWWGLAWYCAWYIIIPYQLLWMWYLVHSGRWSFRYIQESRT